MVLLKLFKAAERKFRSWLIEHHLTLERDLLPLSAPTGTIEAQGVSENLGLLPSVIEPFKDVIFVPPPLFDNLKPGVQVYSKARLLGKNPVALNSDGQLIQESLFRSSSRNKLALSYLDSFELLQLRKAPRRPRVLDGTYCLLASFWDTFGHWVPEHLLKIRTLAELDYDLTKIRFIIREPREGYKQLLLSSAGIKPEQITVWTGGEMVLENLIVPSYPQVSAQNLDWVSSLLPLSGNSHLEPSKRLYLSRENYSRRNITNEDQVLEVLEEFNFETVTPETLPFQDQVDLVRQATALFGPQGSAFTLQIFMRNGKLFEAFPRDRVHLFNRQVASTIGHEHYCLMDSRGPEMKGFADTSINVDIEKLRKQFEWAFGN